MADLAKLVVRLEAQSSQLLTELDKANKKLTGFERQVNQSLGKINKQFSSFGSKIAGIGAGLLGAFSFRAIIQASAEASKNFALLENAVLQAGDAAGGRTARDFEAVSKQLESISTFSDDAIQNVQQLLLRFQNIRTDRFDDATKSALNLASALGKDTATAATLLGKALSDPEKGAGALAKAGVVLSAQQQKLIKDLADSGKQAEAQGVLLDALADKYGGAAEAARNTFGGALEGLKNTVNNLLEVDGGLPEATRNLNELSALLQDPKVKEGADSLFGGIVVAATAAAKGVATLAAAVRQLAGGGEGDNEQVNVDNQIRELTEARDQLLRTRGPNSVRNKQLEYLEEQIRGATMRYQELSEAAERALAAPKELPKAAVAQNTAIVATEKMIEAQEKLRKKLVDTGKALTESLQTPFEKLHEHLTTADKLLAANAIDFDTWQRAVQKAATDFDETLGGMSFENWQRTTAKAATDLEPLLEKLREANQGLQDLGTGIAQKLKTEDAGIDVAGAVNESTDAELDKLDKAREAAARKSQVFAEQAARNTQDILANGIETALEDGFDKGASGALEAFGDMLTKMAAQAIAADIASKIFGDGSTAGGGSGGGSFEAVIDKVGGFLGNLFGGARDSGGRGRRGQAVAIGRGAQPELFVPDTAGDFYPAGMWPGAEGRAGQKVTQNIYTSSPVTQRSARQLELEAGRRQRSAAARLG